MIFRNWVLQNFPFLEDDFDALTDYQLFCKMLEYVKEFAKDNEEFKKQIEDLENYIYNLDIQEAVDTKIQELLDNGTLEEMITSYLQIKGVLGFNNKNALKNATNLIDGSIAKTLGDITYEDGKGNYYKIRPIVNTDVIDDDNIIALVNYPNLVAEKISNENVGILLDLIKISNILKNKKTIIIGDSLSITGRWGTNFINYSNCDGINYGNGSAGFVSTGITPPYVGDTFGDMLDDIVSNMTSDEKNDLQYLIVGGGINDALNNYTPSSIETAVQTFIDTAKTNFPNAKIIIFPINTFSWLEPINLQRYQAIIDTCKNNGIMTTGNFLFWTVDDRTYDSGDHIHLNETGYQVLANKILSFVNGSINDNVENVEFTLQANWEKFGYFHAFKRDNIVYLTGVLHYTGGTISSATNILSFTKGSYLTGDNTQNKYIPAIYYVHPNGVIGNVNVMDGYLRTGTPVNYNSLSSPYIYINGCFVVGMK